MDHTCTLRSKCLKADESLEKCEVPKCKNVIHLSYGKNLMATFGEDEWEGPLFCGKHCFKHHKKSLAGATSQTKGRVPLYNNGLMSEVNSILVLIPLFTTATTTITGMGEINRMALQHQSSPINCHNWLKKRELPSKEQGRMFTTE